MLALPNREDTTQNHTPKNQPQSDTVEGFSSILTGRVNIGYH